MEFKVNGLKVEINPAELHDDQLTGLAQEVFTTANERGLELPVVSGALAVEGVMRTAVVAETHESAEVKETIAGLLSPAYSGFQATVAQINMSRKKKELFGKKEQLTVVDQETVAAEFAEWFDQGRLAYVARAMEANPRFTWTLLAIPNETVTADEYLAGTRRFGESQPLPTKIFSNIVKQYTAQEISGTNPSNGKAVKFKLVPNKYSPEIYGNVATQKAQLAEHQAETPFLEATTPLEDLTWINTKRASGDKLVGSQTTHATYMRNITLEPKRIDGRTCVPDLFVNDDGTLCVDGSSVQRSSGVRLSIG